MGLAGLPSPSCGLPHDSLPGKLNFSAHALGPLSENRPDPEPGVTTQEPAVAEGEAL